MKTEQYEFVLRRLATILAVGILTLSLIAAVTGILLAFYYEPVAGGAYDSLQAIANEVSNGWVILRVHDLAGLAGEFRHQPLGAPRDGEREMQMRGKL